MEEQKLIGYIVYNIWTYRTKGPDEVEWRYEAIFPEVHWKKKIYLTLSRAQEAAKHMKEKESGMNDGAWDSEQIIVPVYANREDLNRVSEGHRELKNRINEK
jgi:hypothetical protein